MSFWFRPKTVLGISYFERLVNVGQQSVVEQKEMYIIRYWKISADRVVRLLFSSIN